MRCENGKCNHHISNEVYYYYKGHKRWLRLCERCFFPWISSEREKIVDLLDFFSERDIMYEWDEGDPTFAYYLNLIHLLNMEYNQRLDDLELIKRIKDVDSPERSDYMEELI